MIILSMDIGIKNLGYCLIDFNEETKKVTIKEWDVINLIEDELESQQKCSHISRNRPYKPCKHFAIKKLSNNKEFYCKTHFKKNYTYVEPLILKFKEINHNCICEKEDCSKKVKYLHNSEKICSSHKVSILKNFNNNYKLKKIKLIKCKDYPINKLADKMINILDEKYKHFLESDIVLLELQPVLKGPKMKTISNYLSMYFRVRGKHDKGTIKQIKYIKATNKLEFNKKNTNENIIDYKNRKKTAINNVYEYLDFIKDDYNKEKFNNHKKKDDLADALLQSLIYIQKQL